MKFSSACFAHVNTSFSIVFSSSSQVLIFNTSGIFTTSIISIFEFTFASSANFFISLIYILANSLFSKISFPLSLLLLKVIKTSTFPLLIEFEISFFTASSTKVMLLGSLIDISLYLLLTDLISTIYSLDSFSYLLLPKPVMLLNILISPYYLFSLFY